MRMKLKLAILWTACRIRRLFEFRNFLRNAPKDWVDLDDVYDWRTCMGLSGVAFDQAVNTLSYLPHPRKKFLDGTFPIVWAFYFFKNLPYGRACEDWARIWSCWAVMNNKVAEEWVVSSTDGVLGKYHFITIIHDDGGYRLCDYHISGTLYPTVEDAVQAVNEHWDSDVYSPVRMIATRYRTWTPDRACEKRGVRLQLPREKEIAYT